MMDRNAHSAPAQQPAPRSYRLVVQYDGTRYAGWQRQPGDLSVQQALEETLEGILCHPVRCHASGRTDAGVHALGQVVRIDTSAPNVSPYGLLRGANTYLPDDIRIASVEPCASEFNPRADARRRCYRYTICNAPVAPVLDRHRVLHVPQEIDWARVDEALARFEGEHDFVAFRSSLCEATRTRLTMRRARRTGESPILHIDYVCRSFLHNMVRLMTGLAIEVGRGRFEPDDVTRMLDTGERTGNWRNAPPHGLVLMEVGYEEE